MESLTLSAEVVVVGKRRVPGETVSVSVRTHERPEHVEVALTSETVEITRIPIGKDVEQHPIVRTDGDVTIIPVVTERLVVEKRLFLVEELHIRRVTSRIVYEETVVVREQSAEVVRRPCTMPQAGEPGSGHHQEPSHEQ